LLRRAAARGGDPIARLNLGLALLQLGCLAEAEPHLSRAIQGLPDRAEPHLALGQIAGIQGRANSARLHFEAALALNPHHSPAIAGLAALHEAAGELDEAARLIDRARTLDPVEPTLAVWSARLAFAQGEPGRALQLAESALEGQRVSAEAASIAARALLATRTYAEAVQDIEARAQLDALSPSWPMVLAALHVAHGRIAKAIAELRAAEALLPGNPEIDAELGLLLASAGQMAAAEESIGRALLSRPNDIALRNRLATVLWKSHRIGEAAAILDRAIADLGSDPALLMNRALLLNLGGQQERALAAADAAVAATAGSRDALITRLCVLPYHPAESAASLREAAKAAAQRFRGRSPRRSFPNPDPERPLTVGLLSGNLCCHPVGWLTVAGIEALPETEFRVVGYSLRRRHDVISARFRARCALWRELAGAKASEIAGAIAADHTDVLVDLGGYGEGGCPASVALRPAPVQIKWIGSQFSTSGMPAIDWLLTDRWQTPRGFEHFYTERLLRLPDGYACYAPPASAPEVGPLPALRNGHVTFGCFNNLAKITQPVLETWSDILARLPSSRLILRTHALGDPLTVNTTNERLCSAGIDLGRVEVLSGVAHRDLLATYDAVDLGLDPFPYNGGLTVCESLWMGVPVVSLYGESFASRHALSHLSNVGLAGWAVPSREDYVSRAIAAAADVQALAALRAGLRARVRASPLCDASRFGIHLGHALRHAWRQYCRVTTSTHALPEQGMNEGGPYTC
jgi:predicted O-linked N-acetylglucosamine transferase (SPINDLY family)